MSTEHALLLMTRAEQALAEVRTLDDVKDIRDKAQAAASYAKKAGLSKDIIIHASAIKVQAERKLGQILKTIDLASGSPGNQYTGKQLLRLPRSQFGRQNRRNYHLPCLYLVETSRRFTARVSAVGAARPCRRAFLRAPARYYEVPPVSFTQS